MAVPAPVLTLWLGAELSQASGTALLTAARWSLRPPAAHWRGPPAGQAARDSE